VYSRNSIYLKFKKAVVLLMSVILLLSSCTRTSKLTKHQNSDEIGKFNYLGKNRDGHIVLKSGESISTEFINLKGDTLEYYLTSSDSIRYIDTQKISRVYFNDRVVGGVDGLWIGSGIILAIIFYMDRDGGIFGDGGGGEVIYLLGGGALIGFGTGALFGGKINFEFESKDNK
jgi:hypothetical protein